jgi:periplasmic protein TonB
MFDDFCPSAATLGESTSRFRRSMAVAVVVYGGGMATLVAATATVRKIIEEKETQVAFAPPPEPEPPPLPPEAAPKNTSPRPRVKRPDMAPPTKISDEKLKESNKALATSGESGPVDGFLDGTPGGRGTGKGPPPAPKTEALVAPVDTGRNDRPRYPPSAKRKGIEGVVVVSFEVLEDGRVANPQIVSGPPELQEAVLRTVVGWRFHPAHRGDKNLRVRLRRTIRFRLEDA